MYVERDTGPHDYFAVPLARAYQVFRDAYAATAGLARTVRGPVMSTTQGKVSLDGVANLAGERFRTPAGAGPRRKPREPAVLRHVQSDRATWLTD